jgi:hypothetical protein
MEMLLPVGMLLFILVICFRFLLGEKIFEHVASKFVYDIIKGLIKLPIQIFAMLFKVLKVK